MDEELKELLKNYITKTELDERFLSQRTASEQFLDAHDRSFRTLEQQVSTAVTNLNAGLSKLNIMSDALSNIMRVMQDNYEAVRIRQRDLEDRVGRIEQTQVGQKEEFKNFYGAIFGDSEHPDQESIAAIIRKRSEKADAQHEATMLRFDNVEEHFDAVEIRQDKIEEQIEKWQRWFAVVFKGFGDGLKKTLPKIFRWLLGMFVAFVAARIGAPGFMNLLGEALKGILGIP